MDVSLPPELEQFIQTEIGSGHYRNPSEVIRAGLRLLKQDQTNGLPRHITLEDLKQRLREGMERLHRGEGIDGKELRCHFEKRARQATNG